MEPETLLFETSPFGSLDAMVEQDQRAAYLYLHSPLNPDYGTRACWIRNLVKGPLVLSKEDMELGIPPLLPRTYSGFPDGQEQLDPDRLKFVWFEEGNGVALLDDEEVIAIIPPWSGLEGFHGYARDCRTENPVCWPMPQQPHLNTRVRRAAQYWKNWEQNNPFKDYQQEMIRRLEHRYSGPGKYFSIDGGNWPPKGIQSYESDSLIVAFTVGLGLCAMPNAELSVEHPSSIRRAEFAIQIPRELEADAVLRWISGLTNYPWQKFTWFGHGHTSPLPQPLLGDACAIFFCDDRCCRQPLPLAPFQDDPVNLIWLIPISQNELDDMGHDDSKAASFVEKLRNENRLP